jgi:ABC-type uncharacterized transport system substrate-binding protein
MNKFILGLGMLCFLILTGCTPNEPNSKVFLVFSYHPEYEWVAEEIEGISSVFDGLPIETKSFYLDTKRNTGKTWFGKISEDAYKEIIDYEPDVVLVFDDNACELIGKRFLNSDMPVVFCGMNKNPEEYGFPARNITGVMELELWKESLEFVKELVPEAEKVIIMNDESPTSVGYIDKMKKTGAFASGVEMFSTNDFTEWQQKVLDVQEEGNVLGLFSYFTLKDNPKSESLESDSVLSWTLQNSNIPECAIFDFTVKNGAFCGVIEDGFTQGKLAAEMVVEILDGTSPEDIPVLVPHKGKYVINKKRGKELGIYIPDELDEEVVIIE